MCTVCIMTLWVYVTEQLCNQPRSQDSQGLKRQNPDGWKYWLHQLGAEVGPP